MIFGSLNHATTLSSGTIALGIMGVVCESCAEHGATNVFETEDVATREIACTRGTLNTSI